MMINVGFHHNLYFDRKKHMLEEINSRLTLTMQQVFIKDDNWK
jgi:hypothetical protein